MDEYDSSVSKRNFSVSVTRNVETVKLFILIPDFWKLHRAENTDCVFCDVTMSVFSVGGFMSSVRAGKQTHTHNNKFTQTSVWLSECFTSPKDFLLYIIIEMTSFDPEKKILTFGF